MPFPELDQRNTEDFNRGWQAAYEEFHRNPGKVPDNPYLETCDMWHGFEHSRYSIWVGMLEPSGREDSDQP
jgi:hypothetical protein